MLRSIVLLLVVLILSTTIAWGDNIQLAGSYLCLSNDNANDLLGNGYGALLDIPLGAKTRSGSSLYTTIGYYGFEENISHLNLQETLVPIMFTVKQESKNNTYVGAGAGIMIMDINAALANYNINVGESKTDFAYQAFMGLKLGSDYELELRYLNGGRNGNTGIGFNLGMQF